MAARVGGPQRLVWMDWTACERRRSGSVPCVRARGRGRGRACGRMDGVFVRVRVGLFGSVCVGERDMEMEIIGRCTPRQIHARAHACARTRKHTHARAHTHTHTHTHTQVSKLEASLESLRLELQRAELAVEGRGEVGGEGEVGVVFF